MELWVRSQDKNSLLNCKIIFVEEFRGQFRLYCNDCGTLGKYDTKERCLEILDEIQKLLIKNSDPLVLIENSVDDRDIQDGAIIECSPKEKAKVFQKSVLVYEMPEK